MARTFNLEFDGYWRKDNAGDVPAVSGIYLVYGGVNNPEKNTVSLKKLLYVGEADDIKVRITKHDEEDCWEQELGHGEEVIFSCAHLSDPERERVEAALIYQHQPPCNDEHKDEFRYDTTTVSSTGKCKFIIPRLTFNNTT